MIHTSQKSEPSDKVCPFCGKKLESETVICVSCGYNFKTKRRLKKVLIESEEKEERPEICAPANVPVEKVGGKQPFISKYKGKRIRRRSQPLPISLGIYLFISLIWSAFSLAVGVLILVLGAVALGFGEPGIILLAATFRIGYSLLALMYIIGLFNGNNWARILFIFILVIDIILSIFFGVLTLNTPNGALFLADIPVDIILICFLRSRTVKFYCGIGTAPTTTQLMNIISEFERRKCPVCGENIAEKDKFCLYCLAEFDEQGEPILENIISKDGSAFSKNKVYVCITGVICAGICVASGFFLWKKAVPSNPENIVANERVAVKACREYLTAQTIYRRTDWDKNGAFEYAVSVSGDNSLYERKLVDEALAMASLGPEGGRPKAGYYFKMLTGQGANAPGGKMKYTALTTGFGLFAYPAKYGVTGKKVFVIDLAGRMYGKDFGKSVIIKIFNPDGTWSKI